MKYLVLFLACVVPFAQAQIVGVFGCPSTSTKANFDPVAFGGKWYEQYRTFNAYEVTGICPTTNVTIVGTNVTIVNKQLDALAFGDKLQTGNGKLISNAKANILYPGFIPLDYTVIDTDYVKYASVMACADFFVMHIKYFWVLTRDKFPAAEVTTQAMNVFVTNKIDVGGFNKTDQFWCVPWN